MSLTMALESRGVSLVGRPMRWAPDRYGRRDRLDVSGTMTVVEMRAFFVAVIGLLE